MSTKMEAVLALPKLLQFINRQQLQVVGDLTRSEEGQFFIDKIIELVGVVENMPTTYEQESKDDEAIVHLHYFVGGWDWYIIEKDIDADNEGQNQAFGFAKPYDDDGELGYISIVELLENRAELDFYWTPKTLREIREKKA